MQVNKQLIKTIILVALIMPLSLFAQTTSGSINAFSPYSMYGLGELSQQGVLSSQSMGGVGIAMRNQGILNLQNPASHSMAPRKTFLFNMGLEGQNFYNTQKVDGVTKESAYNTFNLHNIGFQLPLAKKLGLGFSVSPYSSVGYRVRQDEIDGDFGWGNYMYEGEGDITQVKLGVGWELFKGFSVGGALQYYWGNITRNFTLMPVNITDGSPISSTTGVNNYYVSTINGEFGIQYTPYMTNKRALTIGATYSVGGDMNPEVTRRVYIGDVIQSNVTNEVSHHEFIMPSQIGFGVVYHSPKVTFGADYIFQGWGSKNSFTNESSGGFEVGYANTNTYKVGVEYTPDRFNARKFLRRWTYRFGGRYGDYYQTYAGQTLKEYAISAGFGMPLKFLGFSAIDFGVEYGGRYGDKSVNISQVPNQNIGFIQQQYFKISLGFTIFAGAENNEYWFLRPKYD